MAININQIANEIVKELRAYTSDVKKEVDQAKKDVSKEAVKELRTAGDFKDQSGDYRKGWTVKKDGTSQVIHNKTDYQKTHLLEKGHAVRGGGRARGFEHIAPVEEKAIESFLERVEKAVQS